MTNPAAAQNATAARLVAQDMTYSVTYITTRTGYVGGTTRVTLIPGRTTFADIPKLIGMPRGLAPETIVITEVSLLAE